MSYTTTDTDVHAAIARSRSHDEIVTIRVRDAEAARRLQARLEDAAQDDEGVDYVDANGVIEVWAYEVEESEGSDDRSDDMRWRVHLDYSAQD